MAYTLKDVYKKMKKALGLKINYLVYRALCEEFNMLAVEFMVCHGMTLKLPKGLGEMKIAREKTLKVKEDADGNVSYRRLKIDFNETRKLLNEKGFTWDDLKDHPECRVVHLNQHSSGYHYKYYWNKSQLRNISVYSFDPTWSNKRYLADVAKNNNVVIL